MKEVANKVPYSISVELVKPQLNQSIKYRPDIDGLRAIAVLAVVIYHFFPKVLKGGFVGVDIFFVISGFLISSIIFTQLDKNTFSFIEFYSRRIRRIFPTLIVVLLFCMVIGWFALFSDEYQLLGKHIAGGASYISNFILWSESGYFDQSAKLKPLLHLWSLGIEEQFYIVWPLLLWLLYKKKINLLIPIGIILIASFGFNLYQYNADKVADFYSPFTRTWELLVGALLGYIRVQHIQFINEIKNRLRLSHFTIKETNIFAILGFLLLLISILVVREERFPGIYTLLPVLGTALLIAAGENTWINKNVLSNKVLVWIGLISYPLYLWHWPLISLAWIIELGKPSRAIRIAGVVLSFFLAWITYKFIEPKLRWGKYGNWKAIGLFVLLAFVGGFGYFIFRNSGFPERFPSYQEKIHQNLVIPPRTNEEALHYIPRIAGHVPSLFKNANSKQTIAIIGDSHAFVSFYGIAEVNAELGLNTVFIAFDYRDQHYPKQFRPVVLDVLKGKTDIQYVFMVYRGMMYVSENDLDGDTSYSNLRDGNIILNWQSTIDQLQSMGKKVYFVSENPVFHKPAREFISRPLSLSKRKEEFPVLKKEDVIMHQQPYLDALSKLKNATIIYSLNNLCPNSECHMFNEKGIPFYYDDDHFSLEGSKYQAENLLRPYLEEIAKKTNHKL